MGGGSKGCSRRYTNLVENRPTLDGIKFNLISIRNNKKLSIPFGKGEIKEVIKKCGDDKTLRPHGFTFKFIKKF